MQTLRYTIFHNNEDSEDLSEDIKELASSSAEYFFKIGGHTYVWIAHSLQVLCFVINVLKAD